MKEVEQILTSLKQELQQMMAVQDEQSACKQLLDKLDRLISEAYFDPVTQLPNRAQLMERLQEALLQAQRSGHPLAVMFIDLDRFKYVNDTLGHQAGDALLQEVAQRIQAHVRKSDMVIRVGGDEFVVILPEQKALPRLNALAQGLVARLSEPYHLKEGCAEVGASIGIAIGGSEGQFSERVQELANQLLDQADQAMYQAKQDGRGRVRFYNEALEAEAHKRSKLERQLQQAIEQGQLQVVYDAVYYLGRLEVDGFEAKWAAPGIDLAGMRLCDALQLIDSRSLNEALGYQLIERALDFLQTLVSQGVGRKMAFNLGIELLQSPQFPSWLEAQLLQRDLSEEWVIIELDESNFSHGRVDVMGQIRALSQLGVGLTLDNVGSGAFPLSLLRLLEIDNVKISAPLTQVMLQEDAAYQLIKGLTALCHALKKAVVIDGVESRDQLLALKALECDLIQGTFLGEPLSAEAVVQQLLDEMDGRPLQWVNEVQSALSEGGDEDF